MGTKQKCWILFAKKWRKIIAENCWKVLAVYRWNITINNPKEENLEHEQIKKIMKQFKGPFIGVWLMK